MADIIIAGKIVQEGDPLPFSYSAIADITCHLLRGGKLEDPPVKWATEGEPQPYIKRQRHPIIKSYFPKPKVLIENREVNYG